MVIEAVRVVAALVLAAAFYRIAYIGGSYVSASRDVLTRWVATIALLLWVPTAVFHLLASLHAFALTPALLAVILILGVAFRYGGDRLRSDQAADKIFFRRVLRRLRASPHRWMLVAFCLGAAPSLLHALLLPPMGFDALTYHALKAGMWVQNGGVDSMYGTGPWGYYQNLLGGGEVFAAWAMLPLRSDALTSAMEIAEWLGIGLVLFALARRLGIREPFGSVAVGFFLVLPTVRLLVGSGYVELVLLLALLTGLYLALAALRGNEAAVILSLAAFGVAASGKLPMIAMAGAPSLFVLGKSWRTSPWAASLGVLMMAAALSPWLLLTTARTGLPLSPLPVKVAGLTLGEASPEVQWYMQRPRIQPYTFRSEAHVIKQLLAPPGTKSQTLGLLVVLPFALSLFGFLALVRRSPSACWLIGTVVVADLAFYYAPAFSMIRHLWTWSSSRFLLPLVAGVTIVSVCWCRRSSPAAVVYGWLLRVGLLINLFTYALTGFSLGSFYGVSLLLIGAVLLGGLVAVVSRRRNSALGIVGLAIVAMLGLVSLRDALRNSVFVSDFVLSGTPKYWAEALPLIDHPNESRRIAITSGPWQEIDNWFASPFLGRALQNELEYVPVSADGVIHHWGPGDANAELARTADFAAWASRLHTRHVTEVMSFTPRSIELGWMEAHPELFEKELGNGSSWGLFRVKE